MFFFLNYNFTMASPLLSTLQKLCLRPATDWQMGQQCISAVTCQITAALELLTGVKA